MVAKVSVLLFLRHTRFRQPITEHQWYPILLGYFGTKFCQNGVVQSLLCEIFRVEHLPPMSPPMPRKHKVRYFLIFWLSTPSHLQEFRFTSPCTFTHLQVFSPTCSILSFKLFPRHQVLTLHLFQDFKSSHPGWSKKCWNCQGGMLSTCHQVPLPGAQATWKLGEKRWWGCCRWSP